MRKYEHLASDSEEYNVTKQENLSGEEAGDLPFGFVSYALAGSCPIDSLGRIAKDNVIAGHDIKKTKKFIIDALDGVYTAEDAKIILPGHLSITEAIIGAFEEVADDPEFIELVKRNAKTKNLVFQDEAGELEGDLLDGQSLVDFFLSNPDDFPNEIWLAMLILHVKKFNIRQEEFNRRDLPKMRDKILRNAHAAIDSGKIVIDHDALEARMASVKVVLIDPIVLNAEKNGREGLYKVETNTILIPVNYGFSDQEHVFTHEMMHAISGRTPLLIRSTEKGPGDDEEGGRVLLQDIQGDEEMDGLSSFLDVDEGDRIVEQRVGLRILYRFAWLNEALTETLTMELLGREDGFGCSYPLERKLLKLLIEKSGGRLSLDDFRAAYFENYSPDTKEKVPAWKRLQSLFAEAFGPRILVALDNARNEGGIESAIQLLEKL